ncbi:hypothetical protein BSU00_09515 [Tenacibaculum sp. SG-28]|nr:hypothetical protein BSU00_09515 [Tenacibaculum sp. SG-28]
MKKGILILFVLFATITHAQYTIKGTMTPPEKSDWVMVHKLQGIKPRYILNTTIQFDTVSVGTSRQVIGQFAFQLPKNAPAGMYRATYKNSGTGYVDFLFNKENIEFIFNPKYPEESIVFTRSRENKIYGEYTEEYNKTQKEIDANQMEYIKNPSKDLKKKYKKDYKYLEEIQEGYEQKTEGMLVNSFIKASKRYNPSSPIEDYQEYLDFSVNNFFKNIDFDNKDLYNSSFLIDRINDFVLYLNYSEDQVTQQGLYKKSIAKVMEELDDKEFKKEAIEFLATSFTEKRNSEIVDWLFSEYYDALPKKDPEFKTKKMEELSVSVGRNAPDFTWSEDGNEFSLSTLNDGNNYLMIFWSTGCPHCVKEIPEVHNFLKNNTNTSVVSFAIENDDVKFNAFKENLPGWHNVLGTHPEYKFDNEVVKKYKIDATPTYFVLDKNKKIVAIPNTIEDVKKYFNNI